jgi:hypothetical protein
MSEETIAIPASTRERVQKMLEQRAQIDALIEATLLATREALGVPPMYGLADLNEGFTPPLDGATLTTEPTQQG